MSAVTSGEGETAVRGLSLPRSLGAYREVWVADFEFAVSEGDNHVPVCLVAHELFSGRELRLFGDELRCEVPYAIDAGALYVAYNASAELRCHLALGWPLPLHVLDLLVEFRWVCNGRGSATGGHKLEDALVHYGLHHKAHGYKHEFQVAIGEGRAHELGRDAVLDYCATDVTATHQLLLRMAPGICLPQAVHRGRYMRAVAHIENQGVPIDTASLARLNDRWEGVKLELVREVDAGIGAFDGTSFREAAWAGYLDRTGIGWPRYPDGRLRLDDNTFRAIAAVHGGDVARVREVRAMLSKLQSKTLTVGVDGRNRASLMPFKSLSGRNQPSNSRFVFGHSRWVRSLIRPEPGTGLAYLDWSQQEFGIAAAFSGDQNMIEAYRSGDPYLAFAKQAGAVPADGTKESHPRERAQFKRCEIAVHYGMGVRSLAQDLACLQLEANNLLKAHRRTFRRFWEWNEQWCWEACAQGECSTVFGWRRLVGDDVNPRSLQNHPMQANGAEMLRLACCYLTENEIPVCAPVHDAVLIEAPLDELDEVVAHAQKLMARAARDVLDGTLDLTTDATLVRHPERYRDEHGGETWDLFAGMAGLDL
jgi:hypothetical protein